ncbi:MAG: nitroreductase family protein [Firmicutes bacterium]|nr:nitroreductase family protein [Bacillota bacterium]
MSFLDLARKRMSTRHFFTLEEGYEVTDKQVESLLELARTAPSAGNRQPWHFLVVSNKTAKGRQLKVDMAALSYDQTFILDAPIAIVVYADLALSSERYGERGASLYALQDTAAAIQNILLGAEDIGLATVWVGAFDEEKLSELLKVNKYSKSKNCTLRPIAIIPVGYAKQAPQKRGRKPLGEITSYV